MNLEFHYYIIYMLCRKAGFDETDSQLVAYSSQYIDNNLVSCKVKTGSRVYESLPTQNYGWWNDYYPRNVYLPFHFLPGDTEYAGAERKDRKTNPLNCTPDSALVKELLISSLKTRNLYRVGIALHTYADSWAHQNFSGIKEKWNRLNDTPLIPQIGHAQALGTPDNLTGHWTDSRLAGGLEQISNKQRFLEAARKIYKYLCAYNKLSFGDHDFVIDRIDALTKGYAGTTTREERINNYIIEEDILRYNKYEWLQAAVDNADTVEEDADGFIGYDKMVWLKDALLYQSQLSEKPVLQAKENFTDSHWYRWQEAAREHLQEAQRLFKDLI